MHSSVAYSELTVEEAGQGRRSSIQYIPHGGLQRTLLLFALIVGTTISFVYMWQPTRPNVSSYLKSWGLESYHSVNSDVHATSEGSIEDLVNSLKNSSSKPLWSWTCEERGNKRCVRILATENSTLQSLKTCTMTCERTPVWPLPTGPSTFSATAVPVEMRSIALDIIKSPSNEISQYLQEAFAFMIKDIHKVGPMKHKTMNMHINGQSLGLLVKVTVDGDSDPRLRLDTNEKYSLRIKVEGKTLIVNIIAQSFCGARHGFDTLAQLVWYDQYLQSLVALESASVEDGPKFGYRGLLLDTARQYFPVEDILRTIDAMAASKLNTFHWHAADSQSFPLKLDSVPQMALYGAYSRKQVYTREDIKTIVHRGRVRGIRVVIEVDAPAHVGRAWSWGNASGLGDLAYCIEKDPWNGFCGQPPCGQLNPKNDHVFEILENIYKEVIELTGVDDVFHLGGDEVNQACWAKHIKQLSIMDEWYTFFQKSTQALQNANNGKLPELTIIWSSRLTAGNMLSRLHNYTIQTWRSSSSEAMQDISNAGLRTIASHLNAWYLDCGFQEFCPYRKWQDIYNHRPWENHNNWKVEGGSACMWTELLAPEGTDSRLWPRVAALGERLWTDPSNKARNDISIRLDMQRQRLVERGIRADPIWPRWCSENPYECFENN